MEQPLHVWCAAQRPTRSSTESNPTVPSIYMGKYADLDVPVMYVFSPVGTGNGLLSVMSKFHMVFV